ncbi:MAG: D-cysteine desulfhydrase, partial [Candidatus Bathyarchaeota archaeon]
LNAVKFVAQTEGILLGPIYTGRAMAGLFALIKQGHYRRNENVVFLHTGGTPTLFPYRREFNTHHA